MSRAIVPILLAMASCSPEPGADALEVVVMASCSDDRCEQRILEAVTLSGEPTAWEWTLPDGSTASGRTVPASQVDGLDLYGVLASDDEGGTHRAFSAMASLEMRLSAGGSVDEVDELDTIVIVPMGASCDQIPVVNIGGCLTSGASPLGLQIDAVSFDEVTFSPAGGGTYTSTQSAPLAVWRLGTTVGEATGTSQADYYTAALPAPPPPYSHFTAYFEGVLGGTSTALVSHGPSTSLLYSAQQLRFTCDKEGNLTRLERQPVDRKSLDFDGDGYPEGEDCDETDPDVHEGC